MPNVEAKYTIGISILGNLSKHCRNIRSVGVWAHCIIYDASEKEFPVHYSWRATHLSYCLYQQYAQGNIKQIVFVSLILTISRTTSFLLWQSFDWSNASEVAGNNPLKIRVDYSWDALEIHVDLVVGLAQTYFHVVRIYVIYSVSGWWNVIP